MNDATAPALETIALVVPTSEAGDAISVMHAAFAEFSLTGEPSGALRETVDSLRAEMAGDLRVGVARHDGRAVASVKHHVADDGTLYFSRLGVIPDARGHGLAGRFVRALREHARGEGLRGLSCLVRAEEARNIALYERLGMRIVSRGRKQSRTGAVLDVVAMRDA